MARQTCGAHRGHTDADEKRAKANTSVRRTARLSGHRNRHGVHHKGRADNHGKRVRTESDDYDPEHRAGADKAQELDTGKVRTFTGAYAVRCIRQTVYASAQHYKPCGSY